MWWFLYGLLIGAGGMRLLMWVWQGGHDVAWYAWPLGALALALFALAGQNFVASYKEMEPRAAWMGLLFIGLPGAAIAVAVTVLFFKAG
ncbi:MAG: dehalogenase [Deltaproteobacteria bacterium]|nr:dehalogenase [Deltaproteobacteria bacterium]